MILFTSRARVNYYVMHIIYITTFTKNRSISGTFLVNSYNTTMISHIFLFPGRLHFELINSIRHKLGNLNKVKKVN